MFFLPYDIGSVQPRSFVTAQYQAVQAAARPEAYQGRQVRKAARAGARQQTEPGFSNVLAEEENAILMRLQTA